MSRHLGFTLLLRSVADADPDPHGSASLWENGSGSATKWKSGSGSDPHQSKKQDPDPDQSEEVEGHF
jgi:hypothetical protein